MATTTQTATGIVFDVTGYQSLVSGNTKNFRVTFDTLSTFRLIVRMVDENNYVAIRYDGLNVWAEEVDKGRARVLGMKEMGSQNWDISSREGYITVKDGVDTFIVPYLKIMEGSVGIEAEESATFDNLAFSAWLPDLSYKGPGHAYAEAGRLVLVNGHGVYGAVGTNETHTLTIQYKGSGRLHLGTKTKDFSGEGFESLTASLLTGEEWFVESAGELHVEGIQLETGMRSNIILGMGEVLNPSVLSFPRKNNLYEEGSLLLSLTAEQESTTTSKVFVCGNMMLSIWNGSVFFSIGDASCSTAPLTGKELLIRATFDETGLEVMLNTEDGERKADFVGSVEPVLGESFLLTDDEQFEGAIEHILIWKRRLKAEMLGLDYEPMAKSFESDFNGVISSKEKSFVEGTLAPVDGSPILVEDEKGPLNRVNFFDFETAEYRTFNEEEVLYDGESDFIIVSYKDIDIENFKVQIFSGDVMVSEGNIVEGQRIEIALSEEEKRKYLGTWLTVRYQVERSYTVDYQRAAMDSFRIYLTKHDGLELQVTQEGSRRYRNRLSKEVELNPMRNSQSEGFLYISQGEQKTQGLRVFVSPSTLVANGMSTALVVVEPIDEEGNEVIGASIDVDVDRGVLRPVVSTREAKIRSTGGRYVYEYHAPYMSESDIPHGIMVNVLVKDRTEGIGQNLQLFIKGSKEAKRAGELPNVAKESQIVFEYMAKCFKREDVASELLSLLDLNQDGRVDEYEIEWLKKNMASANMKMLAASLLEREGQG